MMAPDETNEDARQSASQMADAIAYLCSIACKEGLRSVLPDLLLLHEKLGRIAEGDMRPKRKARRQ